MRTLLKIVAWIALAIAIIVLTLPIWFGWVARPVAGTVVTSKTGTGFSVGQFGFNMYNGKLMVGDAQLFNPPNYKEKIALSLGRLDVHVDMGSLLSDTLVINDISIRDVFVSYVQDAKGVSNFDCLFGKADSPKSASATPAKQPAQKGRKKIIIKRLHTESVRVQWGKLMLPMPPVTLTDIGTSEHGITLENAWAQINARALKGLGVVGDGLKGLGANAGELGVLLQDVGAQNTKKALEGIKNIKIGDKAENLRNAAEAFKGLFQ